MAPIKPRTIYTKLRVFLRSDRISASPGSLRGYLIRGTAGTFALQLVATGMGFLTNLLLARFLGAEEYGVYTYIFAWVGLLTVLSMFGMSNVLIRKIAAYQAREEWGEINGVLRWTGTRALIVSSSVALSAGLTVWLLRKNLDPSIFPAFWVALAMLPLLTLFNLSGAAMQGFKHIVLAKIPEVVIKAPLFLILLALSLLFFPQTLRAFWATVLGGMALTVALGAALWLLYKKLPHKILSSPPVYQQRLWVSSALPLLVMVSLYEINMRIPTLMLGAIVDVKAVGLYGVASLVAGLVSFILMSVNTALGPVISNLYTTGEMHRLQSIVTLSARLMLAIGGLISLLFIMSRNWIFLIFGQEYQQADPVLLILILGQIISVAAGSVGTLLVMTGHERDVIVAVGISTGFLITLNAVFIPIWGVLGAGWATVGGLIVWNFLLIIQVTRRLGIDPTALGFLSKIDNKLT